MHICAGIITYNPTLTDVSTCLEALCNQVERVIIVDNASKNVKSLQEVVSKYTNVTLVKNSQNIGFAKALTQVFEWAKSQGFNWVLTLNDDSVVPSNMISEYKKILENQGSLVNQKNAKNSKIAIVCSLLKNRLDGTILHSKCHEDECITSGSLTSVEAWQEIGGFDEWLEIDGVDFDFSRRLVRAGWKIVECQNVIMEHQIGKARSINLIIKHPIVWNHNANRKYYIARNMQVVDYKMGTYSYAKSLRAVVRDMIFVALWEKNKFAKIRAMIRGFKDGQQKIRQMRKISSCKAEQNAV
ncbi:glycosyltransferase, group 2 family protein [Gardnerella pickettii JCP7659]|uniref:Glycosyltransferase, group 2 family protein n=1 Tax=Gardnerella pickettii JCP8017A TaxID=1261062 RepID=T2PKB5_9BIFI|nr:glycosyltransferase [Gardnerella pickettii]EPI52010.1 glycosyltransferase, group 2 family protein [Gardnerella pickettii JCP8017A]EPI54390.1 glycosyltransferase, group 2 family protein [Gardnerella pickettii JCP7659]EPI58630.1 glycosyltransferase, group 2 family protein [Gardnerella pickettii JCP8017B]